MAHLLSQIIRSGIVFCTSYVRDNNEDMSDIGFVEISFSVFLNLSKLTQFDRTETTISLCDIEGAPFAAQSIVNL